MAAVGMMVTAWQPPDAEAVVVCQRKNKVRLRAETCKKKETQVFDTDEVGVERARVDDHDGRLDDQAGRLDDQSRRVEGFEFTLSQTCPGAPERQNVPTSLFGIGLVGGCRTLDGDQPECEQAFQMFQAGAVSCAYVNGNCIACDYELDGSGVCENACQPTACVDPARIVRVPDCDDVASKAACDQSWALAGSFPTTEQWVKASTCWWDGIALECHECNPDDISRGDCENTCLTPEQLPVCRAEGRTYGDCNELDGDEAGCLGTYMLVERGGTQTCFYQAGQCEPCDPLSEQAGSCENLC